MFVYRIYVYMLKSVLLEKYFGVGCCLVVISGMISVGTEEKNTDMLLSG